MTKRMMALGLSCLMTLSLAVPVSAVRVNTNDTNPVCLTDHEHWLVTSADGSLTFSQLGSKIRNNTPTAKALEENLKAAQAMDWNDAIGELEDAIDDMEILIAQMGNAGAQDLATASQKLAASLGTFKNSSFDDTAMQELIGNIVSVSIASATTVYGKMQQATLESTLESLEDQLDDLKDQKKDYAKTLADTERQIESTFEQLTAGAESLYVGILSTELQLETLKTSQEGTKRALEALQLRYELGQISALTLAQVENGYRSLVSGVNSLEITLSTMRASLQSMVGDPVTGTAKLAALPTVSASDLRSVNYNADLEKGKENSYSLYTANRSVEDAEESMNDARKEEGKNSYQYKMAQHQYEAALFQQEAAIESFEVSFQKLYDSLAPAQTTLEDAKATLAYQEKVYAAEELKYELGNISANALADAKDTLIAAQRDCESAELNLFTAWNNYQQAVAHGIVASGS